MTQAKKEKNIYFGNSADVILASGSVKYVNKKKLGSISGIALQLQAILKAMDRPLNAHGRKRNWSSAALKVGHIKHGWYRIDHVYWC